MKCPLMAIAYSALKDIDYMKEISCLKEECAWYSDSEQACSMLIIAANLAGTVAALGEITKKMPKDLAPGR